jgi:hypothetical protein
MRFSGFFLVCISIQALQGISLLQGKELFGSRASPWNVLIGGGGPAGTGPLFAAARTGNWDKLFSRAVLVVEKSDHLAAGSFAKYHNGKSNSVGLAFTHIARAAPKHFPNTLQHPLFNKVNVSEVIDLKDVGDFLKVLGEELKTKIESSGGGVQLRTSVVSANLETDGLWAVELRDEVTGSSTIHFTRKFVATPGAKDKALNGEPLGKSNIKLSDWRSSFCNQREKSCAEVLKASDVIKDGKKYFDAWKDSEVLLIGGGHSTFLLVDILGRQNLNLSVSLVFRSTPKLFYYSKEEAMAANYSFASEDVCPVTGRINRFSGIRALSREHYLDVSRSRPSVGFHRISIVQNDNDTAILSALNRAAVVISTTGFTTQLPSLTKHEQPIKLAYAEDGQPISSVEGVESVSHRKLPGLIMFGIGAGWPILPHFGGEPRLHGKGRMDGVWLYQFDIGDAILERLLDTSEEFAPFPFMCALDAGAERYESTKIETKQCTLDADAQQCTMCNMSNVSLLQQHRS